MLLCGLLRPELEKVAFAQNEGGGPFESALRMFGRQNLVTPLEETTTVKVARGADVALRQALRQGRTAGRGRPAKGPRGASDRIGPRGRVASRGRPRGRGPQPPGRAPAGRGGGVRDGMRGTFDALP